MAVSGMEHLHQTHLPTVNCNLTPSCPGTAGLLMLHPTSSELHLLDKRDLRYYFQHPYPRLFVTYFVIFCNFLLFAEDPISHSHTGTWYLHWRHGEGQDNCSLFQVEYMFFVAESDIPMVGNVFSFVLTKYPPEWRWSLIKVHNSFCQFTFLWIRGTMGNKILQDLNIQTVDVRVWSVCDFPVVLVYSLTVFSFIKLP